MFATALALCVVSRTQIKKDNQMNTKSIAQLLFAMLAVSFVPAIAQNHVAPPKSDVASARSASKKAPEINTISLKFSGGSMAEFVEVVRGSQPKANIVLSEHSRDAKVPPMVLTMAGIQQALEGACATASSDYAINVRGFHSRQKGGATQPIYTITAKPTASSSVRKNGWPTAIEQFVYSIKALVMDRDDGVKSLDVETVLSAIESATDGDNPQPTVRFHRASGLLLVSGLPYQHSLIDAVLRTLASDLTLSEKRQKTRRRTLPRTKEDKVIK
jgi:hypothetical protein